MADADEDSLPRYSFGPEPAPSLWHFHERLIRGEGVWIRRGWQRPNFWPAHRHDHVQAMFGSRGTDATVSWRDPDARWHHRRLKPDEVWFLPPAIEQQIRWSEPSGMVVLFAEQSAVREFCGYEITAPSVRPLQQYVDRVPAIGLLRDELWPHQHVTTERHVAAIGTAFFSFLLAAHFATAVSQLETAAERAWQEARSRAERYMLEHLTEPFSMTKVARAARMSRWYFCRMFKAKTAATPRYFFNKLRILRAKDLLEREGYAITQAMHALGFQHYGHFRSVFKTHLKVDPSYFKQRHTNATAR